jgi:hypothetical protein
MILINLLPQQHRARQRVPLKVAATAATFIVVNCSLLAWSAWIYFGDMVEVASESRVVQETLDNLRPQVEQFKSLEAENKLFLSRETTLAQMTANRVSWTRKLDELIDVIHKGGEGPKYLVWMDDLLVSRQFDKRRGSAGMLRGSAHCGSENLGLIANFLDDLQNSSFIDGFMPIEATPGKQEDEDPTLVPARVWGFPLELSLIAKEDPQVSGSAAPARKGARSAKKATPQEQEQEEAQ